MRIKLSTSPLLAVVICTAAVGSIVYLSTLAHAAASSPSPVPPRPLLSGPMRAPSRLTAPPPSSPAQLSSPADFLDHSIPKGYGLIKGKVIDDGTGAALADGRITIPELKLSTRSDQNGNFAFEPIRATPVTEHDVTLMAQVPGYGVHTMINVGVVSQDTATVLLTLKKGSTPTRWFGRLLRPSERAQNSQADLPFTLFSTDPGAVTLGPLSPSRFSSTSSPPLYIRVGIFALNSSGVKSGSLLRVDTVDFDFYMKHVLQAEWGPPTLFDTESLKAGAMAVKNYAWYSILHPIPTNYDLDNSQSYQVYDPYISYTSSDSAVDYQSTTGWYQKDANGLANIFLSQYYNGVETSTSLCPSSLGYNPNNCMTQWGSEYWADPPQSKLYTWILPNYYTTGALSYFFYPPRTQKLYESNAGTNSITISYSSPSSTNYAIFRYDNNSAWVLKAQTPNTSYTDSSATSGSTYAYIVEAYGPGGWGPFAFAGWMTGSPGADSNPPSPTTTAFFIATSTIEIRAHTTATSVNQYVVYKWNNASSTWVSVYTGMPSTVNNDGGDRSSSANPLPIAFIDYSEFDGGAGDFVYRDATGVNSTVTSTYTVSYQDKNTLQWSNYTNRNGSITAVADGSY